MPNSRIKTSKGRDEPLPQNIEPDFNWIHEHLDELIEQYGHQYVMVFNQQVIGVGTTYEAVLADAERNLDPQLNVATPVTYFLRRPHPFFRVWPR